MSHQSVLYVVEGGALITPASQRHMQITPLVPFPESRRSNSRFIFPFIRQVQMSSQTSISSLSSPLARCCALRHGRAQHQVQRRPVRQGIEPTLGLVTRYYFLSESCFLVSVGRPVTSTSALRTRPLVKEGAP
jgi:hypothetical protein